MSLLKRCWGAGPPSSSRQNPSEFALELGVSGFEIELEVCTTWIVSGNINPPRGLARLDDPVLEFDVEVGI